MTGASILRLVEHGVIALDDPIAYHIDPYLAILANQSSNRPYMNYSSLQELFGSHIANVTVRDLAEMHSGVPDFDTAAGGRGGRPFTDPFRATLYATPSHSWGPLEILSLPWVYTGYITAGQPGYSSTNFMLLGLILARYHQSPSWELYNQLQPLPDRLQQLLQGVRFGVSKTPHALGAVDGFDRTTYNGHDSNHSTDVDRVKGVFAGWTASDLVANVEEAAQMTYSIYGESEIPVLSNRSKQVMIPQSQYDHSRLDG